MATNENTFAATLGQKLKELRANQFTLDEMVEGAKLSISRSSLFSIEKGDQDISAYDLFALSKVLKFSIDDLLRSVEKELISKEYNIDLDR